MVDVDSLSDAELRAKLIQFGFPVMPITGSTRKVMVKKLKLLLDNKGKIGKDDRRSLGRYSSDDESDVDSRKGSKAKLNKRQTIAAPLMQPPSSSRVATTRKSTRFDSPATSTTISTSVGDPASGLKSVKTTTTTTSRTTKILRNASDEFDTGSESDEVADSYETRKKESPIKISPGRGNESTTGSSFSRLSPGRLPSSFIAASTAAEQAADRLSQIRSRYSSINTSSPYINNDKPLYTSSPTVDVVDPLNDKESTPFLSNFTKRLSLLSESPKSGGYGDYKSDIIKENDVNGSSGLARNYLNSYRSSRGRPSVYDYQKQGNNSIFKNNFVPLMVLIVAFLFFIVVAVTYLGIRSDSPYEISGKIESEYIPKKPIT